MRHPSPSFTNTGVPPTLLNDRTGELTPPGMNCRALRNAASELEIDRVRSAILEGNNPESTPAPASPRGMDVIVGGAGRACNGAPPSDAGLMRNCRHTCDSAAPTAAATGGVNTGAA